MIKCLRVGLLRRPYLNELNVSVSLATEEAHVGVGVEQRDEDAGKIIVVSVHLK